MRNDTGYQPEMKLFLRSSIVSRLPPISDRFRDLKYSCPAKHVGARRGPRNGGVVFLGLTTFTAIPISHIPDAAGIAVSSTTPSAAH
jgi:hypothetical protein